MLAGGIHDQLGGGFARYSVDAVWLVPHFEKMLYDNALLARAYLHAWQALGHERYRRVCEETLDGCCGRCVGPRAASTRRSTPTPRARRARSTSGRLPRFARSLGDVRRRRRSRSLRASAMRATSRARTSSTCAGGAGAAEPEGLAEAREAL